MTACPCARAHTGEAACRAFQQSGTQRSDADLPVHIARHALLACAPIVARQTQDPLRRRDIAGQRHPDNDSARWGDPAPAWDGTNGRVGRRALVPCTLHPPLVPPLLSLLTLRGRGGVVVGKTDGCLLLGLLGWLDVFRNDIAKTQMFDGPARPYRSAGAARAWALSVYGLMRSTSYQSQSVRTQLHYITPIHSFLSIGAVGPFWSWKVGPPDDDAQRA